MKRFVLYVVILVVLAISVYYVYANSYVKYTPITNYSYDFLEQPELNTELHKQNLKVVLNRNNIGWKMNNGEMYIKRQWAMNKRKVNNFTNKANELEYVKYIPAVLKDPNTGYVVVPELKVNMENLKTVLSFHGEKWKIVNGELHITKKLALDKEMIHNYTQMANDDKFVEQLK